MTIKFYVKGYEALISDEDKDLLSSKWHLLAKPNSDGFYLQNVSGLMHRIILSRKLNRPLVKGEDTDHKDNNPLNNERSNLRVATRSQNNANKRRLAKTKRPLKGVQPKGNRWQARLMFNGKNLYLGSFTTPEQAHAAYCEAAKKIFGEFARFE